MADVEVVFCRVQRGGLCNTSIDGTGMVKYSTDSTGQYNAEYLDAGEYRVYFRTNDAVHLSEWYDDAVHPSTSTVVTVSTGAVVAGIDSQLDLPSVISGRVSGLGSPLVGGTAEVYVQTPLAEAGDWDGWQLVRYEQFGSGGEYQLQVHPGTYRVLFRGCFTKLHYVTALNYMSCGIGGREWYGDQPAPATSLDVVAARGGALTLDAQLAPVRPPTAVERPRVIGRAKVGQTLRVSSGTWDPASAIDDGPFYRWYAGRKAVTKGYTETDRFKITRKLEGKKIWVKVVARVWGSPFARVTTKRTASVRR